MPCINIGTTLVTRVASQTVSHTFLTVLVVSLAFNSRAISPALTYFPYSSFSILFLYFPSVKYSNFWSHWFLYVHIWYVSIHIPMLCRGLGLSLGVVPYVLRWVFPPNLRERTNSASLASQLAQGFHLCLLCTGLQMGCQAIWLCFFKVGFELCFSGLQDT